MTLVDHAVWWHVYPLGALGAPIHDRSGDDAGHRLPRLEAWLDYVVELGCSGVLLGPIFASTSHGYDTLDHFHIDPRLGDDADFDHFVSEAQARGLSILLDGVFNHVGVEHALVHRALAQGGGVRLRHDEGRTRPEPWEGHADLAVLDHADPGVADLVVDVMLHWLRRGIAGWRLDVAYGVPAEFWREVVDRVHAEFPAAVFVGEVIHGDYAQIVESGGLDSVTQYELWKAIWSSLKDKNLWELAWALDRHEDFSTSMVAQTFAGNHDVTRIASQVGDGGAAVAAAIVMTLPGMPSVYYGDEQGFRGEKGFGLNADTSVRPPLPERPSDLAPYGWWLYRLHQDLIGLRRRNPWITRGHVRVVAKDCRWITYQVSGEDRTLDVDVSLDPTPSFRLAIDGAQAFTWPN